MEKQKCFMLYYVSLPTTENGCLSRETFLFSLVICELATALEIGATQRHRLCGLSGTVFIRTMSIMLLAGSSSMFSMSRIMHIT